MTILDDSALTARLDRLRRRHGVPAIGAAIIGRDAGTRIAVVGNRIRGRPDLVTSDDRWHIGSCAKAMTAAVIARLVERGITGWSATLPELLGDIGDRIDAGWRDVTLTQLLTHGAGLPANLSPTRLEAATTDPRPVTEQRTEVAATAMSAPPDAPGGFRYSNLGYIIAGAVIERLTGVAYETALAEQIFHPLGIRRAGFGPPVGDQPWGHRARGRGLGRGPAVDPATTTGRDAADNPPVMTPAGRVHLPLDDWARFIRVFIDPEQGLLQPASLSTLTTPAPGRGTRQAMGWAPAPGKRTAYGQQGSNACWMATCLIAADERGAALVVCNDGRTRLLITTARIAADLLPGD